MEAKVCPLRAQNDPLKFSGTYVGVINLPGVSLQLQVIGQVQKV